MYATAHRVRAPDGREAIHAFLHRHGSAPWPADVVGWPESNPGELIDHVTELPLGGNAVRTYLDVLAPDALEHDAISQVLKELHAQLWERPNPTVVRRRDVTVRFGVEPALEAQREQAYRELSEAILSILERNLRSDAG
jgi:hypothetical protein